MARWLLLSCLFLSACGGGGGGSSDGGSPPPPPPPPPVCCAALGPELDAAETQRLAEYETRRDNAEAARASNGTYFSGAHLEQIRDMATVFLAPDWCADALAIVDSHADEGISPNTADLVEDYRDSMLAYVLADYDAFTSHPNWTANAAFVAQIRQEIIDGMNAEFDQLQVDLQGYY